MNTLDWECGSCGLVKELSGYSSSNPPLCDHKRDLGNGTTGGILLPPLPMEILWSVSRISAWERPWKYWDKDGKEGEFKSIADVRRYERDCERRAAAGEGNIEVAAQFSMDRSNRIDPVWKRPTFKPNPFTRSGKRMVFRRGEAVARDHGRG